MTFVFRTTRKRRLRLRTNYFWPLQIHTTKSSSWDCERIETKKAKSTP